MIVRQYFKCQTCDHAHILRVGLGFEPRHEHTFPCENCGEDIKIAMVADQEKGTFCYLEAVDNTEIVDRDDGGTVVNLHANFAMPKSQRNVERAFPHLPQMNKILTAMEGFGTVTRPNQRVFDMGRIISSPHRKPNYGEEWKLLKKAWRLTRNDRLKLADRQVQSASTRFHADEPLSGLDDWIWRFISTIGQPSYEKVFINAFDQIKPLIDQPAFGDFLDYYKSDLRPVRGERYLDVMKSFFQSWPDFSQIFINVVSGVGLEEDHQVTTVNFDGTKMFYGNTFEALASSVDILACLNNIISGRAFDTFQTLTLRQYQELDKAGRARAFSMNPDFAAICPEWDNQIRNASHHGSFSLNPKTQIITYKAGRGGTGPEQQISYAQYLFRSTALFEQLMVVFRIEVMICHLTDTEMPF